MQDIDDMSTEEYKKRLNDYHKLSDKHVLVLETDLSYQDKCKVFHYADLVRKAGNELVSIMRKKYEQLIRTKKYRKLKELYGRYANAGNEKGCKDIAKQLDDLMKTYNVTWDFCRKSMMPIYKKYNLHSVLGLTKAEDIWHALEKCLFSDGKTIHFSKKVDLPNIRAKQISKAIIFSVVDGKLRFKFGNLEFGVRLKDKFDNDEVKAILEYLEAPEVYDRLAVKTLLEEGTCISTYRPCYASLVCKKTRGKLRVYLHITIEGIAKPKFNKDGSPRHKYGKGAVGCDIGTQTIAYTSDSEVGLKNLAERGSSILSNERKERLLYRAMDRSRRATNPDNYNPDGTVKKGKKTWKYSKRYQKLKAKHTELCRINAENRHLAINEDVNHLRSLGDMLVTESKNAKKLQKRAKTTAVTASGKPAKKKRFGRSVKNRCPGYFQAQVKRKFNSTGGIYAEVPNNYRASQYDHTADDYIKKKLSDRFYKLSDGTPVQRDWYSSYLLYCYDKISGMLDKDKCNKNFNRQYAKEQTLIEYIKRNHLKILNSGIKTA